MTKVLLCILLVAGLSIAAPSTMQLVYQVDGMVGCLTTVSESLLSLGCDDGLRTGKFVSFDFGAMTRPDFSGKENHFENGLVKNIERQRGTGKAEVIVNMVNVENPKVSNVWGLQADFKRCVQYNLVPSNSFIIGEQDPLRPKLDSHIIGKVERSKTSIRFYDELAQQDMTSVIAVDKFTQMSYDYRVNPLKKSEFQFIACADGKLARTRQRIECDLYLMRRMKLPNEDMATLQLRFNRINLLQQGSPCAQSVQMTDKHFVLLSCYNTPVRGQQGNVLYRLDPETLKMSEVFRNRIKTPTFMAPKLYEFDNNLSVMFFIEQRLNDEGFDRTFVHSVEFISYFSERGKMIGAQGLTVNRRYQFSVKSKEQGKGKKQDYPPTTLDLHNYKGNGWPNLVVSTWNHTRNGTQVFYIPYCGLRAQVVQNESGMSGCKEFPKGRYFDGPRTFTSQNMTETENPASLNCTERHNFTKWARAVQVYACAKNSTNKYLSRILKKTKPSNLQVTTPLANFTHFSCQSDEYLQLAPYNIGTKQVDKCVKCGDGCAACDGRGTCTKCVFGAMMFENKCQCPRPSKYDKKTSSCNCEQGKFLELVKTDYVCSPCGSNCTTCSDAKNCTECKVNFVLDAEKTCQKCDNGTFYDKGNCKKCAEGCISCDGLNNCMIWDPKLTKKTCNPYTFLDIRINSCLQCPKNCISCNRTTCLKCDAGTNLTTSGKCMRCDAGKKFDSETQNCNENCSAGFFLTEDNTCEKVSDCEGAMYLNREVNECENCAQNCEKCSNSTTCEKCKDGTKLQKNGRCKYACPSGYFFTEENSCSKIKQCNPYTYLDEDVNECKSCPRNCEKCDGEKCLKCGEGYNISGAGSCIKCEAGTFFGTNEKCNNCLENCATCVTYGKCTKCKEGMQKRQNGICAKTCGTASFSQDGICTKCAEGCLSCTSKDKCTEWNPSKVKKCNPYMYLDTDVNQCKACPSGCKKCDKNKCLKCADTHNILTDGSCKQCQSGKFFDEQSATCMACKETCDQCSDSKTCDKCKAGLLKATDGQCYSSCPEKHFSLLETCQKCREGCLSCKDDKTCEKWDPSLIKSCNPYTYLDSSLNVCKQCPKNCKTCTNTTCLTCSNTHKLTDGKCNSCPSNCDQCIQNKCTKCSPPATLLNNGSCIKCAQGQYFTGSKCAKCRSVCKTCDSISKCLTCKEEFPILSRIGACSNVCPRGSFVEKNGCVKCGEGCLECTGKDQCTKWDPEKVKKCNPFTYLDTATNQCEACAPGCEKCNAEVCLRCKNDSPVGENGQCNTCPTGQYLDKKTDKCLACNKMCKTCSLQPNNCDKCHSNYLINDQNLCIKDTKCDVKCAKCKNNSKICEKCIPFHYFDSSQKCRSRKQIQEEYNKALQKAKFLQSQLGCEGATFFDGQKCEKCPGNCEKCTGLEQCTLCVQGLRYNETGNQCECGEGFSLWGEGGGVVCKRCGGGCRRCGGGDCIECEEDFFLLPQGECKLMACGAQEIFDEKKGDCQCKPKFERVRGICEPKCAENSFRLNNTSDCKCIKGFEKIDNDCVPLSNNTCAENATFKNGTCTCNEGFQQKSSGCVIVTDEIQVREQMKKSVKILNLVDTKESTHHCLNSTFLNETSNECIFCPAPLVFTEQFGCIECPESTYFEGGACKPCMVECRACRGGGSCESCKRGKWLDSRKQCINEITCNTSQHFINGSCKSCQQGSFFYPLLKKCVHCHPSCKSCDEMGKCTGCPVNHILDGEKQCVSCEKKQYAKDNKCLSCDQNCDKCEEGGICQRCGESSILDSKTKKCVTCEASHYFSQEKHQCEKCNETCKTCTEGSKCTECQSGHHLNTQNQCVKCPLNCVRCGTENGKSICLQCDKHHFLNEKYICKSANEIKQAQAKAEQEAQILKAKLIAIGEEMKGKKMCLPGFFFDERKQSCWACTLNCDKCGNETTCVKCRKGFQIDHKEQCIACGEGTFFSAIHKQCRPCQHTCTTCSDEQKCESCPARHVLTDQGQCNLCQNDQYEQNNECKSCGRGCLGCAVFDYQLQCHSCIGNSTFSLSSGRCECHRGLSFNTLDGTCSQCPANCQKCQFTAFPDKKASCLQCDADHFVNKNGTCKSVQNIKGEAENRIRSQLVALKKVEQEKEEAVQMAKAREVEKNRAEKKVKMFLEQLKQVGKHIKKVKHLQQQSLLKTEADKIKVEELKAKIKELEQIGKFQSAGSAQDKAKLENLLQQLTESQQQVQKQEVEKERLRKITEGDVKKLWAKLKRAEKISKQNEKAVEDLAIKEEALKSAHFKRTELEQTLSEMQKHSEQKRKERLKYDKERERLIETIKNQTEQLQVSFDGALFHRETSLNNSLISNVTISDDIPGSFRGYLIWIFAGLIFLIILALISVFVMMIYFSCQKVKQGKTYKDFDGVSNQATAGKAAQAQLNESYNNFQDENGKVIYNAPVILKPDTQGIPVLQRSQRKSAFKSHSNTKNQYDSKNTTDPLRGISNMSGTANLMDNLNLSARKSSRLHSRNTSGRCLQDQSTFQLQTDFEGCTMNLHLSQQHSPQRHKSRIKASFQRSPDNFQATWAIDQKIDDSESEDSVAPDIFNNQRLMEVMTTNQRWRKSAQEGDFLDLFFGLCINQVNLNEEAELLGNSPPQRVKQQRKKYQRNLKGPRPRAAANQGEINQPRGEPVTLYDLNQTEMHGFHPHPPPIVESDDSNGVDTFMQMNTRNSVLEMDNREYEMRLTQMQQEKKMIEMQNREINEKYSKANAKQSKLTGKIQIMCGLVTFLFIVLVFVGILIWFLGTSLSNNKTQLDSILTQTAKGKQLTIQSP